MHSRSLISMAARRAFVGPSGRRLLGSHSAFVRPSSAIWSSSSLEDEIPSNRSRTFVTSSGIRLMPIKTVEVSFFRCWGILCSFLFLARLQLASNYCYVCFLTKYTCFPYYLFRSPLWETVSPSKLSAIFWSCIDNCLLGMPSDFQICIIAI